MADEYAVRIDGLEELLRRFDQHDEVVRRELRRAMTRAVVGEVGRMPSYPPPPVGSTYRRTLQLGRSLTAMVGQAPNAASTVEGQGDTIRGIVGTNVVYAPFVVGQNQAKVHRGRWWRLEASVLSHKAQIEAEFEDAAERIVEALAD